MCTEGERKARRVLAKTLLLHTLRIGEGPAAKMADEFTDEQIDALCAIHSRPPQFRRQEIKALLSQIADASRTAAPPPDAAPDLEALDENDGEVDESDGEPANELESEPEPPRRVKRPK